MTKRYQDLSDDQVLEAVGNAGPAIVGHYLFERAEWVRKNNPLGVHGPTITGDFPGGAFVPSEKAKAELRAAGMLEPVKVEVPKAVKARAEKAK